ncbi:hypothetical protein PINS_up017776 [Pythium insidiosum]|nr:hypothetical protein PINS_up017776 [Pythium insidiosum]
MEQQLRDHAIRVYNEFVCAFQRRASVRRSAMESMIVFVYLFVCLTSWLLVGGWQQRIAANRVMIEGHRRQQARTRRQYPETVDAIAIEAAHGTRRQQSRSSSWGNVWLVVLTTGVCSLSLYQRRKAAVPPDARVRKTARTEIRTPSESLALSRLTVVLPRVPATPNATMWTALSKNYDVEDDRQLRFLPYFGDDDDEDVISEFFEIQYVVVRIEGVEQGV